MTDFHALYQQYAPAVRRLALFLSGDPALADDITSDTFVRAWTTSGPLREETVKAYLFTIARHLYYDSLRQDRLRVALDESIPDSTLGPERQTEIQSELGQVLTAMNELSLVERTTILMRAQEGLSYEEIARTLGVTVGAVKVRIHRARLKLIRAMRGDSKQGTGEQA